MEYRAPGFRFYPTEEELVSFYLHKKLLSDGSRQDLDSVIPVLNIYEFSPWDLPKYAGEICHADSEQWFFFIPRQHKEMRGGRPNRMTSSGYWKATGSPGFVYSSNNNRVIGSKRTMVFYKGRAPKGTKTEWKMNEYRAAAAINEAAAGGQGPNSSIPSSSNTATPKFRQELSLCRVYKKSKCLRSFDRRPSTEKIGEGGTILDPHGPNHEASTTSSASAHQNQSSSSPLMVEKISESPAVYNNNTSTSGGDHSNENINSLYRDLPMWEWEWEWELDQPFNCIDQDHL